MGGRRVGEQEQEQQERKEEEGEWREEIEVAELNRARKGSVGRRVATLAKEPLH